MGLLDKISSAVRNTVSSVEKTAEKAVDAVKSEVSSAISKPKDEYAGVIKDKALETAKPPPPPAEKHWYSGITDAFAKTEQNISNTVSSTVHGVEKSVSSAYQAVSDAGQAVSNAGHQVVDSGARILHAAEKTVDDVKHVATDAARVVSDAGQTAVDAGKAAYHAGAAALTGDPRELDAAHNAITRARSDVADAHAAVTDAHARISDVGDQASAVKSALTDAKTSLENARDKLEAAGSSVKSAINAVTSAPGQIIGGVEKAIAQGGKDVRTAIERDVPGGKQMLAGLDKYGKGAKEIGEGVLGGNLFQIARGVRDEATGAVDFSKGLYESPAGQYAKGKIIDYANGFNPDKQISDLKPGESYSIKVGADVHVEFGAEAKAGMSIKAEKDGTYTVDANAVAGANGYLSAEKIGTEGVEASAHLLLGGKAQFKCANAGEAQKLAHILEKAAAAAAASGQPGVGTVAAAALMPSKEDMSFLKAHATSVELSGKLAASAEAGLGIPGLGDKIGAKLGVGLSGQESLKIDLKNGVPTGFSVKQEYAGEVEAKLGLTLPGEKKANGEKGEDKFYKGASGKLEDKLTIERHFDLPKDVSFDDLVKDPKGTLAKVGKEVAASEKDSVTLGVEGGGKIGAPGLNKKGDFAAELKFTGKPEEVLNVDVLKKAMGGDFEGALKASKAEVEGDLHTVDKKSWGVDGAALTIAGVGVGGTLYAEKTHDNPPVAKWKYADGKLTVERPEVEAETTNSAKLRAQIRG